MRLFSLIVVIAFFEIIYCEDYFNDKVISRSVSRINSKNVENLSGDTFENSHGDKISVDDLFFGLNEIWLQKENKNSSVIKNGNFTNLSLNKNLQATTSNNLNESTNKKEDANVLLQVKNDNRTAIALNKIIQNLQKDKILIQDSNEENYENHWVRIRAIVTNMQSMIKQLYDKNGSENNENDIFALLDKLMMIGDKINMVHKIENKFDHELIAFLNEKWANVSKTFVGDYPLIESLLSIDAKVLFVSVARGLAKQFGILFHKQALSHLNEQDFVLETMRTSGFKDTEIYDVFRLLDLPTDKLIASSKLIHDEARNLGLLSSNGYYKRADHHGSGYNYKMMTKDPFILLAGLSFAAFAAYVIYRLLTTTAAARKRSMPDVGLSLELSDMPEALFKIYKWLDETEEIYENNNKKLHGHENESFANSINGMWKYFQDQKSYESIGRYLCNHFQNNVFRFLSSGIDIEEITLLGLAQIMGYSKAGIKFDEYITDMNYGIPLSCLK